MRHIIFHIEEQLPHVYIAFKAWKAIRFYHLWHARDVQIATGSLSMERHSFNAL